MNQSAGLVFTGFSLTGLVGCDGDGGVLPHFGRQRRHAVLRLDLEGVVGVRQQVGHCHRCVVEAGGSGQEAHVASAGLAALRSGAVGAAATAATLAQHGEGDVPAAAAVLRPAPVQDDRGLVDGGDDVPRRRRRPWRRRRR